MKGVWNFKHAQNIYLIELIYKVMIKSNRNSSELSISLWHWKYAQCMKFELHMILSLINNIDTKYPFTRMWSASDTTIAKQLIMKLLQWIVLDNLGTSFGSSGWINLIEQIRFWDIDFWWITNLTSSEVIFDKLVFIKFI
jgi:hypothetical protein